MNYLSKIAFAIALGCASLGGVSTSFGSSATKGFGSAPSIRMGGAPKSFSHATSGFGSGRSDSSAAKPTDMFDRAVSRGISKDALDGLTAKKAPIVETPVMAAPSAPITSPPDYRAGGDGHDRGGSYGGGYNSGLATGVLLNALTRPRATGAAEYYPPAPKSNYASIPDANSSAQDQIAIAKEGHSSSLLHFLEFALVAGLLGGGVYHFFFMKRSASMAGAPNKKPDVASSFSSKMDSIMSINLRPSGRLKLSSVPFILADAGSSDIVDVSGAHSIESVGSLSFYGLAVERAYFNEGKAFLERGTDRSHPGASQLRVYTLLDERFPADPSDWAFFIGSDGSNGVEPTVAYIGAPSITLPPNNREYQRAWGDSDGAIKPVAASETVTNSNGSSRRDHATMEYFRTLTPSVPGAPALNEYIYIEEVRDDAGASIKVWVGVDITEKNVEAA